MTLKCVIVSERMADVSVQPAETNGAAAWRLSLFVEAAVASGVGVSKRELPLSPKMRQRAAAERPRRLLRLESKSSAC